MSKYEKGKKFYWLQLMEDFFDEDAIAWLEEQEHGERYSLFYLKLCLKALKTNGILIRQVGKIVIPYDPESLSNLTKTHIDTVRVSMELLKRIGLVEMLEHGEIFLTKLDGLIGEKSVGAFKKQQQRLLGGQDKGQLADNSQTIGGQSADKCPPDIELDIEIDKLNKTKLNNLYKYINKGVKNSKDEWFGLTTRTLERLEIKDKNIRDVGDAKRLHIPENILLNFQLFYWAIYEICHSSYRTYMDKLTREDMFHISSKVREYIRVEDGNYTEFMKYFIICLRNKIIGKEGY